MTEREPERWASQSTWRRPWRWPGGPEVGRDLGALRVGGREDAVTIAGVDDVTPTTR